MCLCTSWSYYSSEVAFILFQWTGSGLRGDRGAAQHLVSAGKTKIYNLTAAAHPDIKPAQPPPIFMF